MRWFSIEAMGRVETTPGATQLESGDRVEAVIFAGGLMPCLHHPAGWFGCVQGLVGALQGRAPDVVNPNLGSSPFRVLGVRGGYACEISHVFALRAALEGALPLVRTSLLIDRKVVWTAAPIVGGADLGLIVTLL